MAFLLPFLPAIAEAVGTGALAGGGGYLASSALKKMGFEKGGIIQGKKGQKKLIIGHGGEMILPVSTVKKIQTIMKRKGQPTTLPQSKRKTLGVKKPKPKPKSKPKGRKKK